MVSAGNKTILAVLIIITACAARVWAGGAEIVGIKGGVEVRYGESGKWYEAELKKELPHGTTIRTGPGAGVVILLAGGSTVKLNENTEFNLTDPMQNDGIAGDLEEGDLWSLMEAGEEPLKINTPSAVVAVRGTEFALGVEPGGEGTVTVVAGLVEFGNEKGTVSVGTSQQSTARPGEAPAPPIVVDTRHWIKWTLDLRAMGSDIETPFTGGSREELAARKKLLEDGDDFQSALELARILYDLGEYGDALEMFESCYEKDETYIDAVYGIGMASLAIGDVDAAEDSFYELIDKMASGAGESGDGDTYLSKGYFGVGLVYLKLDMPEEAGKNFNAALKSNPGNDMAYVGLAEVRIREGRAAEAAELLEDALEKNPDNFQALTRLALADLAVNRLASAVNNAEEAVETAPDSAAAWSTLARVYFFNSEKEKAEEAARKSVDLDRYNAGGREVLARLLIMENRLREAVTEALVSLAMDERNPYANDDLALIYYLYRKYDEAIRRWEMAIEADPHFNTAKIRLAHLYNELEETATAEKAEKLARAVLKEEDNNDGAWSELGRALEMMRKYRESEEAYLKALGLNPGEALHLGRLASFYIQSHRIDLAIEYAVRAVGAQPENPANHFTLGRAYEAVDNLDGAEAAYLTALSLDPDYSLARYQLGIIYTGQGKSRDALAEMHTAALERPRAITLAEYRGANRVYAGRASHDTKFYEGVHTDSNDGYRLNYRFVLAGRETDGFRKVNGDYRRRGGSLLAGYQPDADTSMSLYGDFTREKSGMPGKANGMYADDPDDREKFESGRFDASYRTRVARRTILTFRYGEGKNESEEYFSDDINLTRDTLYTDIGYREKEIRGDYEYSGDTKIAFGAFQADSNPRSLDVYEYYDFFTGGYEKVKTRDTADYEQKNGYFQLRHRSGPGVYWTAGFENAFHNAAGSRGLYKFGLDYRLSEREWLHAISREQYRLNYFPRYQPRDGWTHLRETDISAPGTESKHHEINYEARLRDGSFFKAAAFYRKSWEYNPAKNFTSVSQIYVTKGYRAEYEKQLSQKANMFVAVAQNETKQSTPADPHHGLTIPYTPTRDVTAGFYYFFSSKVTLKTIYTRYGKRFTSAANDDFIDRFELTNAQLRYDPDISHSYMLTVYNLFDKDHQFRKDYPEDGRSCEFSFIRWF